jgi:CBS-domain-containing membrane protein
VRVKDIMSRPVYTVRPADPIERAAALLADRQITAAPVLDGDGELVGMVSEGDLLWHRVPPDVADHYNHFSGPTCPARSTGRPPRARTMCTA